MTVVGIEVPPFWIMSQWPFFGLDNLEGKSLETVLAVLKKKKKKHPHPSTYVLHCIPITWKIAAEVLPKWPASRLTCLKGILVCHHHVKLQCQVFLLLKQIERCIFCSDNGPGPLIWQLANQCAKVYLVCYNNGFSYLP